jgi:hypothetical protein
MRIIRLLSLALFSVLLGASLLNLLPIDNWVIEINRSLGVYYLIVHCLLIPVAIWISLDARAMREIWVPVAVNVLMFVYYAVPIIPLLFHYSVPDGDISCDKGHTLLFVQISNQGMIRESAQIIEQFPPDIILASVSNGEVYRAFQELLGGFPNRREAEGPNQTKLVIASRPPLGATRLDDLGQDLPGALVVELPGQRVPLAALAIIVGVDPLSERALLHNRFVMRRSSSALRALEIPVVAAVSLRMTPHSEFYRVFKEHDTLRDLFSGQGLVRTWSGRSDLIRLHYDQLFARGTILAPHVATVPVSVFDHFPIHSVVRFCN